MLFGGKYKAFTLIEVLIAVFLATFIILGTSVALKQTLEVKERLNEKLSSVQFLDFLITFSRELYKPRKFTIFEKGGKKVISFETPYTFTIPYGKVEWIFYTKSGIEYREYNPYSNKLAYKKFLPFACDINFVRNFKNSVVLKCYRYKFYFYVEERKEQKWFFFN